MIVGTLVAVSVFASTPARAQASTRNCPKPAHMSPTVVDTKDGIIVGTTWTDWAVRSWSSSMAYASGLERTTPIPASCVSTWAASCSTTAQRQTAASALSKRQ